MNEGIVLIILFMVSASAMLFFFLQNEMNKGKVSGLYNTIKSLEWEIHTLKQEKEIKGKEDFVTFLDESRDMAFEYIEEAQKAVQIAINSLSQSKVTKKELKEIVAVLQNLLPGEENAKR